MSEHLVNIYIQLSDEDLGTDEDMRQIHIVEDELEKILSRRNAGFLSGDEFGDGEGVLYLYGPDADRLAQVALNILQRSSLKGRNVRIYKRYGSVDDFGAREEGGNIKLADA